MGAPLDSQFDPELDSMPWDDDEDSGSDGVVYSHDPLSTGMRDALHLDSDGSDHSQHRVDSKGKGRVDTDTNSLSEKRSYGSHISSV